VTIRRSGCPPLIPISNLTENEKNIVERNVSTSGVSIYFEAYLYNANNCTSTPWHLPPMHMSSSQRRPSTAIEEDDEDSPSECHTPEKVKKPKKVYCYVSPKVGASILALNTTTTTLPSLASVVMETLK
jgi:hypothetical protein